MAYFTSYSLVLTVGKWPFGRYKVAYPSVWTFMTGADPASSASLHDTDAPPDCSLLLANHVSSRRDKFTILVARGLQSTSTFWRDIDVERGTWASFHQAHFKVNFWPVTVGAASAFFFLFGFPHIAQAVKWLAASRTLMGRKNTLSTYSHSYMRMFGISCGPATPLPCILCTSYKQPVSTTMVRTKSQLEMHPLVVTYLEYCA